MIESNVSTDCAYGLIYWLIAMFLFVDAPLSDAVALAGLGRLDGGLLGRRGCAAVPLLCLRAYVCLKHVVTRFHASKFVKNFSNQQKTNKLR